MKIDLCPLSRRALGFSALMLSVFTASLVATAGSRPLGSRNIVTAPTCSQADVQAALDAAADGDTVQIPAGNCSWSSRVSWMNKNLLVQGAGKDITSIACQSCFAITSTSATSAYSRWRLSNMTLQGPSPISSPISIFDNVSSWHYGWRIDHMKLSYPGAGSSGDGIYILGATYGVIDSNEFLWGNGAAVIAVAQMAEEYSASLTKPQGGYVLSQPLDMGTNKAVYIEDNTFTSTVPGGMAVYDTSSGGGRAVFRYNTVTGGIYYSHWTRTLEIGGRLHEIYNNRFLGNDAFNAWPIRLEAGTGAIFNNTIQNHENYAVLDERRGFLENSPEFGACDGTKSWDGNAGDPAAPGWPCLGQIGRSSGKTIAQIVAGDKLESAPLYLWNNGAQDGCRTGGACTNSFGVSVYDGSPMAVAYVRSTPHPNGEVDYVLNGSTPKPGYTPFTYPHPLRSAVAPALLVDPAGNGVLEIGETAVVAPFWTNSEATDVALTGTASNLNGPGGPTYAIPDSAADYGVIPPGTTSNCLGAAANCYAMRVDGARPQRHLDLTFDETVAPTGAFKTWTLHVGGSFGDVSTDVSVDPYYPFIETVFHKSVTAGCLDGTVYCPADPTSREQMAVFLLKSLQGSSYAPPTCGGIFADVACTPGIGFADWIEDLYARGITAGCQPPGNPLAYCPGRDVLRDEIAVFLLKTSQGFAYRPVGCVGIFVDVACTPGVGFADWIEDLYSRGITAGCQSPGDPLAYCPDRSVPRQEMAVFLTKSFGLVLYGP